MKLRCIALDNQGKQCRRKADGTYTYHGESELYYDKVSWVAAPFCFYHHDHLEETHKETMARLHQPRKKES